MKFNISEEELQDLYTWVRPERQERARRICASPAARGRC
jgi:hypothetical protein